MGSIAHNTIFTRNGTEVSGLAKDAFKPSVWNAINEFLTVGITSGDTVTYTFVQPTKGVAVYNSWSLAFWDGTDYKSSKGTFVRADTWLNKSSDAGFKDALWSAGGVGAEFTYETGYDYKNTGMELDTSATVVLTITYDGTNVDITQTINGTKSFTVNSSSWK